MRYFRLFALFLIGALVARPDVFQPNVTAPGGTVTLSGKAKPGTIMSGYIYDATAKAVHIGVANVGADGSYALRFVVPPTLRPGAAFVQIGCDSCGNGWRRIDGLTIAAAAPAPAPAPAQASTGGKRSIQIMDADDPNTWNLRLDPPKSRPISAPLPVPAPPRGKSRALIFFSQKGGGVLAWAFEVAGNRFCFGGLEGNGPLARVAEGGMNGGFYESEVDLNDVIYRMTIGKHGGQGFGYESYKIVYVERPNVTAAKAIGAKMPSRGFASVGNASTDATFQVIKAYANGNDTILPWPVSHPKAEDLYNNICSYGGDLSNPLKRTERAAVNDLFLCAFVFVNRSTPIGLGHIGFGFQTSRDRFCYGSVEGAIGSPPYTAPGDPNGGFWVENATVTDMLTDVKSGHQQWRVEKYLKRGLLYSHYKVIKVRYPNIEAGLRVARTTKSRGYSVAAAGNPNKQWLRGNNCADAVFDVIKAYASDDDHILPWPSTHPTPNHLFDHICTDGGDGGAGHQILSSIAGKTLTIAPAIPLD